MSFVLLLSDDYVAYSYMVHHGCWLLSWFCYKYTSFLKSLFVVIDVVYVSWYKNHEKNHVVIVAKFSHVWAIGIKSCYVCVGLGDPDPGSKLVALTNKSLHYWPFRQQPTLCRLQSHPKQYGGMQEPCFYIQRLVWCLLPP